MSELSVYFTCMPCRFVRVCDSFYFELCISLVYRYACRFVSVSFCSELGVFRLCMPCHFALDLCLVLLRIGYVSLVYMVLLLRICASCCCFCINRRGARFSQETSARNPAQAEKLNSCEFKWILLSNFCGLLRSGFVFWLFETQICSVWVVALLLLLSACFSRGIFEIGAIQANVPVRDHNPSKVSFGSSLDQVRLG